MNDIIDRLRLIRTEGVGPLTYRRLMERFGTVARALEALPELARAGGRASVTITSHAEAERELAQLNKLKGRFVFVDNPDYPEFLSLMPDAPPALAVLGDISLLHSRCVGVVGARNASANGMRMAEQLGADLAEQSLTVVSGLARGIDAAAHKGALAAGKTIAAIAGGIDVVYPPENEKLQAEIAEKGCLIAEAPFGTAPMARHFPKRNRVIAGLSLGLVVIEAAARSGSLLTARLANEAGREIFAVPGSPLDPRCKGSNDLIRQGAHLTESAADVLANLPDHPARQGLARDPLFLHAKSGLSEPAAAWESASDADIAQARRKIPGLIGLEPTAVDEIARRCQLSTAAVMAVLLELELAARVEMLSGNRVVRIAAA
jgi:DNA processing protein